jgi:hypothetical protein
MAQPSDAAQREQARYEDQLAEARERYDALRSRKAACAALALAGLLPCYVTTVTERARRAQPRHPSRRPIPRRPPTLAVEPSLAAAVAHCWPLGNLYSPSPSRSPRPERARLAAGTA